VHEITSESQNQSQNKTCQVKTKPGRSKAQPYLNLTLTWQVWFLTCQVWFWSWLNYFMHVP